MLRRVVSTSSITRGGFIHAPSCMHGHRIPGPECTAKPPAGYFPFSSLCRPLNLGAAGALDSWSWFERQGARPCSGRSGVWRIGPVADAASYITVDLGSRPDPSDRAHSPIPPGRGYAFLPGVWHRGTCAKLG